MLSEDDDPRKAPQKRWLTDGALKDAQDAVRQGQAGEGTENRFILMEELERQKRD